MRRWLAIAACVVLAPWAGTPTSAVASPPFELRTGRELSLLVAGGLLGAAAFVIQDGRSPLDAAALDRLDAADINTLDRGAAMHWSEAAAGASDKLVAALLVAPAGIAVAGGFDDARAVPLVMYAETMLLTSGITQLLKGAVPRVRPYVYNDDPAIPAESKLTVDARRSFPSSHAANAFAAAVFLARVHDAYNPDSRARPWVWAGALAVATTTATLRCVAGQHFPTDVVAGAAIGAVAGWAVPALHRVYGDDRVTLDMGRGVAVSLRF